MQNGVEINLKTLSFFLKTAISFYKLNCHYGGPYHIETKTSPLICSANRWTGFYMIVISVMKKLKNTSTKNDKF